MRILFYSSRDFELPYLEFANKSQQEVVFIKEPLSLQTAENARGFDVVSIFTGDDASAPVLKALYSCGIKYMVVRAAGYDHIDITSATELGISIVNVPDYSPYAIAEHAVALILTVNRNIIKADKQVHHNNFTIGNLIGFDLKGKTVGVIGAGKIGGVFLKIMHGFGCRLLAYDICETTSLKEKFGVKYVDLDSLCIESVIISIHVCLTPQTKHLIDKKRIASMKQGVILINTSRGACVNTADVIKGLEDKKIGYFGTDVYENEKGIFFYDHSGKDLDDPQLNKLLKMENVLITPHQAFATKEALTNIADAVFGTVDCWQKNIHPENELTSEISLHVG